MSDFGSVLKRLRKEKKLTLVELAKKTGYSQPYLSQLENNKRGRQPSVETINTLAEALNIPNGTLLMMAGLIDGDPFEFSFNQYEQKRMEDTASFDMDIRQMLKSKDEMFYDGKKLTTEQKKKAVAILDALFYQE